MKLDSEFIDSMRELLGGELDAFLAALGGQREYGFRVNTLKTDVGGLINLPPQTPVPWCAEGFYYDNQASAPLGKNPLYNAGLYYIQEPSAMSAAALLDAKPMERVLDLCASPGGKTAQLAAAMQGQGLLVSNDASSGRIPQLLRNIEMAGIKNAIVLCETPNRLAARLEGYFDKVLVDAPCSGEGMFRKDPAARAAWDPSKPARLANIQKTILHDAAKMVNSGGFLVYSTCTFNKVENEDVVGDFLAKNPDFRLAGEPLRIFPHTHRGEGHFAAKLQKIGEREGKGDCPTHLGTVPGAAEFHQFRKLYNLTLQGEGIFAHSDRLFLAPPIFPNLSGLRIIRAGLFLGTLKKKRFTPSYALALALKKGDFSQSIDLEHNDPKIQKFLGGETFEICAPDGYSLFCVEAHPIGFAKVLKNRLKGRII